MKPICIIQIGFSALEDQRKLQGIFFFYGCWGRKRVVTLEDLFHTAVHFTERQLLKDSVQPQPTDFKIWVRYS